jgi:hypothetical protein
VLLLKITIISINLKNSLKDGHVIKLLGLPLFLITVLCMGYYTTMYKINHNLTLNLKMEQIKTICVNVFLADKQNQ